MTSIHKKGLTTLTGTKIRIPLPTKKTSRSPSQQAGQLTTTKSEKKEVNETIESSDE